MKFYYVSANYFRLQALVATFNTGNHLSTVIEWLLLSTHNTNQTILNVWLENKASFILVRGGVAPNYNSSSCLQAGVSYCVTLIPHARYSLHAIFVLHDKFCLDMTDLTHYTGDYS